MMVVPNHDRDWTVTGWNFKGKAPYFDLKMSVISSVDAYPKL